jgi:hypothetical protein
MFRELLLPRRHKPAEQASLMPSSSLPAVETLAPRTSLSPPQSSNPNPDPDPDPSSVSKPVSSLTRLGRAFDIALGVSLALLLVFVVIWLSVGWGPRSSKPKLPPPPAT